MKEEKILECIDLYQNKKLSCRKIGDLMDLHDTTINKILRKRIKMRNNAETHRKYNVNDNFFKNPLDWEQKHAYFLGWLMSDGHHNIKAGTMQIRLQEKDKNILEILKKIINYTGPLNYLKRNGVNNFIKQNTKTYQNRWGLNPYSREVSKDLLELGIDNHKSESLVFPKYLKESLIPHFLRAFYDGDGTVSYSYDNRSDYRMTFDTNVIATKEFCYYLQNYLNQKLNLNSRIVIDKNFGNGNIELKFTGLYNALKFFNFYYKDAKFVLKRKFRKYLHLINYLKRKRNWKGEAERIKVQTELNKAILIAKDIIQNAEY